MKKISTLAFLLSFTALSFSQTLVNQTIAASSLGTPAKYYDYIKGVPLSNGGFALMYNNYFSGLQLDAYSVIVIDSNNNTVGNLQYSSLYPGNNYGTNIYAKGQYLYVVGFTMDSTGINSILCNTLKIDISTADTIWTISESIDSAVTQAPFSVIVDDSGSVYLGASVHTPVDYKIEIVKYNPAGQKVWQSFYDTTGLYTIPVAMAISPGGNTLVVTGFSFDGMGHSDFLTVNFTTGTGAMYGCKTSSNGTGVISHPVNIAEDEFSNSYIAGTSTVSGTASVIKLMAYDAGFNQLWMTTWGDSTLTNIASGMTMGLLGLDGNIFVTGSVVSASGKHSMVVLRYTTDGTLQWARTINAPNLDYPADGIAIATDGNGNCFVTGTMFNGTDTTVATAGLDSSGNMLWLKNYNRGPGINDAPYGINYSGDIGLLVTTRSFGADSLYMGLQYQQYTKTNTLTTTSGGGQSMDNQLIIRFDPSAINQDAVNNIDINFAAPSYWLTASADSALQANVPFDLSTCTMERIYKGLKATYKYSIARNGDTIPIPNLWAGFVLYHPAIPGVNEASIGGNIQSLFPVVLNTSLNYVGRFTGACYNSYPFPATCHISDPNFFTGAVLGGQENLWGDTTSSDPYYGTCDPFYNINIYSAWQLETGKPFVKVGIYDTGLDGLNDDFCPVHPGDQPGTKANGWDFYNNVSLPSTGWVNSDDPSFAHGTWNTGIIGAIRNNGHGIAGIAGGNYTDTADVGVTLYGMKIFRDTIYPGGISEDVYTQPVSDLCNALVMGCTSTDSSYGFGLHVINCSWGMMSDSTAQSTSFQGRAYSDSELVELEQAFKYVYRNQTTIVAAAGNYLNQTLYPANFYNDWVICVGGADTGGNWYQAPQYNAYNQSYEGPNVDLIAPSSTESGIGYYITSTDWSQPSIYHFDRSTNELHGTSTAAPHATGTIALLMSYLNTSYSSHQNLSPEDAEHLLTRNADNKGYIGHSDSTGWGALNAGRVLQDVNKNCRQLLHRNAQPDLVTPIYSLQKSYTPISLTEAYTNLNGQSFLANTPYLCQVYKSYTTVSNSLPSGYDIADYWARPSSTYLLLAYDSLSNTLMPFEHLYIDSITNASATVSGFYYKVFNPIDTSFIGYWGMDSTYLLGTYPTFAYTVLAYNPTCTATATSIKHIENQMQVLFYPNPVDDVGLLQIYSDANTQAVISIVDQQGRNIETIYSGSITFGNTTFNVDTKKLSSGLYFITINSDEGRKTIKFTKL